MLNDEEVKSLKPGTTLELKKGEGPSFLYALVRVISVRIHPDSVKVFVRILQTYAHGGHIDLHAGNATTVDPKYLTITKS